MISQLIYKGPLVIDTSIHGERKCDGIIPMHPGILQVSRNRWVLFIATIDPSSWDATKSIIYQLRADAPDGPVIKEGLVAPSIENWDPLNRGDKFSKRCGMAAAFGVPKGVMLNGKPMLNNNIFVVKWYRYAFLRKDGELLSPNRHNNRGKWPEGEEIAGKTLRLEWQQFCLNDREDDIEILQSPRLLCQNSYESSEEFCALGPGHSMNHAMTPPIPLDKQCQEWIEFDTFGSGQVAPVRYKFNTATRRYEWVLVFSLSL